MICFPNAKINLGLQVVGKRSDHFHNISSIVAPVAWYDVLEFQPSEQYSLTVYGIIEDWNKQENLVTKAWQLLNTQFNIPAFEIHLFKSIPAGAGLGGGSADAAFFIKAVNKELKLGLSIKRMKELAELIGSDCPFFIENKTVHISGKGEISSLVELKLENYFLFIVKPEFSVSTADAYEHIQIKESNIDMTDMIHQPIRFWKNGLKNDFEEMVFHRYPFLAAIKKKLYDYGAEYVSMSGSGSAIYGIFENEFVPPPFFDKLNTHGGFLFQIK